MSKKVLISGLLVAIMASMVGGVFAAIPAQADVIYPYGGLVCNPMAQSANSGDLIGFYASYNSPFTTPVNGQFTWQAVGGSPSTGMGSFFSTRFFTTSINTTQVVTVTDGYQTASCTVYVNGGYYPTPTATPVPVLNLSVNPGSTWNAVENTTLTWNSSNMSNCTAVTYPSNSQWSGSVSPNGSKVIYGLTANTTFVIDCYQPVHAQRLAYFTANNAGQTPTPTISPTPNPWIQVGQLVSNTTRGIGASRNITAYSGDRLQFVTQITPGSQNVMNVRAQNVLPSYLSYVPGTTTVDGMYVPDAVTGAGLNMGTLSAYRVYTVRFEAIVQNAPSYGTSLTNRILVSSDNVATQIDSTTISVIGNGYVTPTPTPNTYTNGQGISLAVYGRDVTRGQSSERSSVVAHANDTLDIIIRVRSTSSTVLSNVYVTDILPAGLSYISRSTALNGVVVADGITTSGLNIGTVYPNQEVAVKFSVLVNPNAVPGWGQVNLFNTAQVRADGVSTIAARLPITLGSALSIAAISRVKTGPADSVVLSALIAVVVAGLYAMYTNTAVFGRRVALAEIRQSIARKSAPNLLG